jgi:hypothetical protein
VRKDNGALAHVKARLEEEGEYLHCHDCSLKFHELKLSELESIAISILYYILSHNQLELSSEDSLYWYLSSHFSAVGRLFPLQQKVKRQGWLFRLRQSIPLQSLLKS